MKFPLAAILFASLSGYATAIVYQTHQEDGLPPRTWGPTLLLLCLLVVLLGQLPFPEATSDCTARAPHEKDQEDISALPSWEASAPDQGVTHDEQLLHHRIEQLAIDRPSDVALTIPASAATKEPLTTITFAGLNNWANVIAKQLLDKYVKPSWGTVVGVGAEGEGLVAGIFGVWKTGNPYTPLAPSLPQERLSFILSDASVPVVLVDNASFDRCSCACGSQIALLPLSYPGDNIPTVATESHCRPNDLSYVLYTSGSTGKPKGVRATHRSMYNRFDWMWTAFPFAADEACLAWTSPAFVDHVWEIFGCLGAGVPLVYALHTGVKALPHEALQVINDHQITRLVMVPSLLRGLLDAADAQGSIDMMSSVRYVTVSGEALPCELVRRFLEDVPGSPTLLNIYGSTEVAADVTCAMFQKGMTMSEGSLASIGHPITGVSAHLLNPTTLSPVRLGEVGELFLGGKCLAEGYLNRPTEEAERFVTLPSGVRTFRTGDFCRMTSDGALCFVGRQDQQVKVNGQRVEVLEVEEALQKALRGSGSVGVVVAVQGTDSYGTSLCAFIAPPFPEDTTRRAMEQSLPTAWVPSQFHELPQLPLLPTGKVNRKELADIAAKSQGSAVVDSLGVAKQVSQELSFSMSLIHCAYFVAIVHVILSHWYSDFCEKEGSEICGSWHQAVTEGNFWMVIFYFGFGVGEHVRGSTPRIGKQEKFMMFLYISWDYTLAPIFRTITQLAGSPGQIADSWFLLWMVSAKLVLVVAHQITGRFDSSLSLGKKKPHMVVCIQVLFWLGLACLASCYYESTGFGFAHVHLQVSTHWPYANLINVLLFPIRDEWFMSLASYFMSLAAMTVGFGSGTQICMRIFNMLPESFGHRCLARVAAALLLAVLVAFGDMHDGTGRWHDSLKFPFGLPIAFCGCFLQVCCLLVILTSLPAPMLTLGRITLVTFLGHTAFENIFCQHGLDVFGLQILPGSQPVALKMAAMGGNLFGSIVLYLYAVIFIVTIAWPLSRALVLVTSNMERLMSDMSLRSDPIQRTKAIQ